MIQKSKGLLYEDDTIDIFFGNRNFSLGELTSLKPTGVHTVKQIHSDIFHIVDREEATHPQPEGDALGTELKKQYLAIKTADCLPVMIHAPDAGRVAAIHAGWKGVAVRIVPKVIEKYFKTSKHLRLFIGPHIMQKSFEIRNDVWTQLQNSIPLVDQNQISIEARQDKFNVNLTEIVALQVKSDFPKTKIDIITSNVDTKTNLEFYSHRRDPSQTGRNISYIKLK
ncbi:MAG: polyphenol oxidase family protein [Bdellovibrionaceae bacterium]|nr:polyphenol oxidase family protein [Pseudobdellovibrionaceae bacterium]